MFPCMPLQTLPVKLTLTLFVKANIFPFFFGCGIFFPYPHTSLCVTDSICCEQSSSLSFRRPTSSCWPYDNKKWSTIPIPLPVLVRRGHCWLALPWVHSLDWTCATSMRVLGFPFGRCSFRSWPPWLWEVTVWDGCVPHFPSSHFVRLSFVASVHCILTTTFANIYGPNLALRGPSG